jgi:hypothetical protein
VTGSLSKPHLNSVQWLGNCAGARDVLKGQLMLILVCGAIGILASLGCTTHPRAVKPPKYDAQAFASALLQRCDADGDDSLNKQEAEGAPGILSGWSKYDTNGNGAVSRDELQARVEHWSSLGDGLIPITCDLRLRGRRIGNVQVKLVPDEAFDGVVQPAMTISDPNRATFLSIPPDLKLPEHSKLTGMQYGLFRVEVSHPSMNLVPAAESRGVDIGPVDQGAPVVINVESRSR